MDGRTYIAIGLKSFYALAECIKLNRSLCSARPITILRIILDMAV